MALSPRLVQVAEDVGVPVPRWSAMAVVWQHLAAAEDRAPEVSGVEWEELRR